MDKRRRVVFRGETQGGKEGGLMRLREVEKAAQPRSSRWMRGEVRSRFKEVSP
jgi:hypothetical protein